MTDYHATTVGLPPTVETSMYPVIKEDQPAGGHQTDTDIDRTIMAVDVTDDNNKENIPPGASMAMDCTKQVTSDCIFIL